MREIASIIEARGLTQDSAAALTGLKQPDVSRIVNSRFQDISTWKLLKVLSLLGAGVMIAANPGCGEKRGIVASQTVDAPEETGSYVLSP